MNRIKTGEVYQLPNNKFEFVCIHCPNEFQLFTEFTLHVQTHFNLVFKQSTLHTSSEELCKFESSSSIAGPLIASTNIKVIDESEDDFDFTTNHFESEIKEESSASYDDDDDRGKKRTVATTAKKFECFICHKKLGTRFATKRHMKRVHRRDDLNCKDCNKTFRTSHYYERHLEKHTCLSNPNRSTFVSQKPILDEPIQQVRLYECDVCKRTFRDRRQLQSHKPKHQKRPSLCLVCGKLFSGDITLGRHMKLHDPISESHPCTECGRKFKQRRYLLHHNRKVHNLYATADDGPSTCEVCDEQFQSKRELQIHMMTHPYVPKRKFPCPHCNHSSICAYDLKRHIETHSIENRSFECSICHRKLLPRYANEHMKTHDSIRKWECNECGKTFKRANTLRRHQSTHQTKSDGSASLKCDVCATEFARMDGLLRHRRRHNVAMNYHCRICNKGFIEQKSFLFHEAHHTKGDIKSEQI